MIILERKLKDILNEDKIERKNLSLSIRCEFLNKEDVEKIQNLKQFI